MQAAHLRETNAVALPCEKDYADPRFQKLYLLADRARRDPHPLGSHLDATVAAHLCESAQPDHGKDYTHVNLARL